MCVFMHYNNIMSANQCATVECIKYCCVQMNKPPVTNAIYIKHCLNNAVKNQAASQSWLRFATEYIYNTVRSIHRYTLDGNS